MRSSAIRFFVHLLKEDEDQHGRFVGSAVDSRASDGPDGCRCRSGRPVHLSIVWTARDAYMRVTLWYAWALLALVPFVGVIAYCSLRPPLMKVDRDEQELEIALKQRELMKYGECANCGYPVENDYVLCPNCHTRLKNLCPTCHHALDPESERLPVLHDPDWRSVRSASSCPSNSRRGRLWRTRACER